VQRPSSFAPFRKGIGNSSGGFVSTTERTDNLNNVLAATVSKIFGGAVLKVDLECCCFRSRISSGRMIKHGFMAQG